MTLRALDRTVTQQALIAGAISDSITGQAPRTPVELKLEYRTVVGDSFRPFPVQPAVNGQRFVVAGSPESDLPLAEGPPPPEAAFLRLRLSAEAAGYQPLTLETQLQKADFKPTEQQLDVGGAMITVIRAEAPIWEPAVALVPQPVSLAGHVLQEHDPQQPVRGAQVEVTAPVPLGPVATDVSGRFRLDNLPVAAEITVRVTHDGEQLTEQVRLDFGRRINQRTFSVSA